MDGHFPELGSHGLLNLGIIDFFHFRLQVGPNGEMPFDFDALLLPDAAATVAPKTRLPGVPVFIGGPESIANITARGGWEPGGLRS
jgi:hypothetical protein